MLRPVHTTTIARAAPVAPIRRRRPVAGSPEAGTVEELAGLDGLAPFETAASGMSALLAAGARTTPAFKAALLKLGPGGQ